MDGKMKKFQESIMETVETKKEELEAQMKKYKQKELEEYENEILSEAFVKIQSKISQLNAETEKELMEITTEFKRKLYELSGEYFEKIFLEVMERLIFYTETIEYKNKFLDKISTLPRLDGSIIKITLKDIHLKESIEKVYENSVNVITDDEEVLIGGFIFENKTHNLKEDQSLFTKLENQKDWFYQNSGLIVNCDC